MNNLSLGNLLNITSPTPAFEASLRNRSIRIGIVAAGLIAGAKSDQIIITLYHGKHLTARGNHLRARHN
jgi:hypothetical protein